CGVKGGAVYGKTDAQGQRVADGEVGAAEVFATIYKALGINPHKNYYVGSRPVPLVQPGTKPIKAVLAWVGAPWTTETGPPREVDMATANPEKLKAGKQVSAKGIFFTLARVPDSSRLFLGGSDFKVSEVDLSQAKPEFQDLGKHDSYVTGVALAG